jgi:hypothetical protein
MKKTALIFLLLSLFASKAQAQIASTSQAQVMVDVAKNYMRSIRRVQDC